MHNKEQQTSNIINLISQILNLKDNYNLNGSTNIADLGFNSISIVKLIVNIEEFFNIEFDDDQISLENINTIDELVKYIDSLCVKA